MGAADGIYRFRLCRTGICLAFWVGGLCHFTPPRNRWVLPVSFLVAVFIGYAPVVSWELSLSRTICFFPFFIWGVMLDKAAIDRVVRFKWLGLFVLVGLLIFSLAVSFMIPNSANLMIWNSFYASAYSLPEAWVSGPVYRVGDIYFIRIVRSGIYGTDS